MLTNERDHLNVLYDQAKEELQKARHDLLQNAQAPKVSLAAQSILRKVENERDNGEFVRLSLQVWRIVLIHFFSDYGRTRRRQ